MNNQERNAQIEEITREFLENMGFPVSFRVGSDATPSDDGTVFVNIETEDSRFLIGKYGANLSALQHLLRIIITRRLEEKISLNIDINGYKDQHKQNIVTLAQRLAAKAVAEGKPVVLEPMNSFERRVVHMELADFAGVKTESIGDGLERKVVIRPVLIGEELDL